MSEDPIERHESHSVDAPELVVLPRMLTPFQGRERFIQTIVELISKPSVRLLTLTGPGGVGKTRLALRAAEIAGSQFADGTRFIPLAPVVDPSLVLSAIAWELG